MIQALARVVVTTLPKPHLSPYKPQQPGPTTPNTRRILGEDSRIPLQPSRLTPNPETQNELGVSLFGVLLMTSMLPSRVFFLGALSLCKTPNIAGLMILREFGGYIPLPGT